MESCLLSLKALQILPLFLFPCHPFSICTECWFVENFSTMLGLFCVMVGFIRYDIILSKRVLNNVYLVRSLEGYSWGKNRAWTVQRGYQSKQWELRPSTHCSLNLDKYWNNHKKQTERLLLCSQQRQNITDVVIASDTNGCCRSEVLVIPFFSHFNTEIPMFKVMNI